MLGIKSVLSRLGASNGNADDLSGQDWVEDGLNISWESYQSSQNCLGGKVEGNEGPPSR